MRGRALDAPRLSPERAGSDSIKGKPGRRGGDGLRRLLETIPLSEECFRHDFPPLCQDALRRALGLAVRSGELDRALSALKRLDEKQRSWQKQAVALLAGGNASGQPLFSSASRRTAVLLSLRPVAKPDALIEAVSRSRSDEIEINRLLALLNTDTTATLPMWHRLLTRRCEQPGAERDPVVFLAFVKCLQHRLMDDRLFARSAPAAMSAANDNGRRVRAPYYHPVLDYLGLTESGYFRLMYNSLLNSLVFEEPAAGWKRIAWARRFPGERYMLAALERLSRDPSDAGAMHIARWTYGLERTRPAFGSRLGAFRPAVVMLLSVIRRDMDAVVAAALGEPNHGRVVRWLRQGPFVAFRQAASDAGMFAAWCIRWGPAWEEALAAARRAQAPDREEPPDFTGKCLAPDFQRLVENLSFVWALSGVQPELLRQRARAGSQAAMLALALSPIPVKEAAELLHSLRERATQPQAKAVETALAHLAKQSGEHAVSVSRSAALGAVHDDAGLRGHQARVWPDVAGWTVKLSVAQGKPEVAAYGPKGRAERLPPEVRQHPLFQEVKEAEARLSQQHRRFRQMLEDAMVSQKEFDAREFADLRANALFAEMSDRLVLECGGEFTLGWADVGSRPVRVAHPVALPGNGVLREWQERVSESGVTQPFKQCFREMYVVEESEADERRCLRFSGHQVLARSAFALLRSRGWTPASGCAYRGWPEQGVRARLVWAEGVAGVGRYILGPGRLQPVVTGPVYFRTLAKGGEETGEDLPLREVDPVVFSEALRDADLLVARAAAPDMGRDASEARAYRAALLRQFAREHGLNNILVGADDTFAIVHGARQSYRIHLGSGSVFTEPEGRHVPTPTPAPVPGLLPLEESNSRTARIAATVLSLAVREG